MISRQRLSVHRPREKNIPFGISCLGHGNGRAILGLFFAVFFSDEFDMQMGTVDICVSMQQDITQTNSCPSSIANSSNFPTYTFHGSYNLQLVATILQQKKRLIEENIRKGVALTPAHVRVASIVTVFPIARTSDNDSSIAGTTAPAISIL